jgi:hypothetical protein
MGQNIIVYEVDSKLNLIIADIAIAKDGNNFDLINYTDTIFKDKKQGRRR